MTKWLIVLIVLVAWLEIKNRKERPVYEQVERENAELLEGRFQGNPVLRRRFMRALVRYCCSDGYNNLAYTLAQNAAKMATKPEDRAACALLMAFNLEERGDYAEAIDLYDTVLSAEPDNLTALHRKAKALGVIQEEDCIGVFEELIRRAPDDAVYRNNYGSALLRINHFEEAETQLKKAIELDKNLTSPYGLLVLAYYAMEDSEKTEAAIADAVTHGADEAQLRQACKDFEENVKK